MPRSPDILRLIDRIARERELTDAEMAAFVGVHPSSFVHARAGRQPLTGPLLARILRAFPEREAEMKELAYRYLTFELSLDRGLALPSSDEPTSKLPAHVTERVRRYVHRFPEHYLGGRCLAVTGEDARVLASSALFALRLLAAAKVPSLHRSASVEVRASERTSLVRARLLVVERVEYATDAMRAVLAERLDLDRPLFVTTARALAESLPTPLASRLTSRCTEVPIIPPAPPDA